MARLIPEDSGNLEDIAEGLVTAWAKAGEWKTLKRLRDELPDDLAIFHSIYWASASETGSVYGEIDFIVANRYGKLLAIEQKDAPVYVAHDDLKVDYSHHKGKSIRIQVARNIGALRDEFSRRHGGKVLSIDHLLYLPNSRVSDKLPASVDPQRVVDAAKAAELCTVILALFDTAPMPTGDNLADPTDIYGS